MSTTEAVLSVREVFGSGRYLIPIYQRAYAWGEAEIETLLSDISDYRKSHPHGSYFIGSLVTHRRRDATTAAETFEVVDGQQRLTTLFIALAVLAELPGKAVDLTGALIFEGRARSSQDLRLLATQRSRVNAEELQEFGIKVAAETVRRTQTSGKFSREDVAYLLDQVRIVRSTLPAETDLNHYFEVMNSRGEQLEKHEIVKAHLMGQLTTLNDGGATSQAFARVWDACTDLSSHVQARFDSKVRTRLFGRAWDEFTCNDFDQVIEHCLDESSSSLAPASIEELLVTNPEPNPSEPAEGAAVTHRYGAIIDFSNFLLHVLRLTVRSELFDVPSATEVRLDDKHLVDTFRRHVSTAEQVKVFAFNLLRLRYLFDRFVIKTDRSHQSDDDSNWVLHRVRKVPSGKLSPVSAFGAAPTDEEPADRRDNHRVILLQSMFQVTESRRSYKNFLLSILAYLGDTADPVTATGFVAFLENLAADRFRSSMSIESLDHGTSTPHFAFNYLDYLIWRRLDSGVLTVPGVSAQDYRFRYRTSVEHFYPRHPDVNSTIEPLPTRVVDQFGNLCLMSRSENSRRSNLAPAAKVAAYRSESQSLKFQLMAATTRHSPWTAEAMKDHGAQMLEILNSGTPV